jgi:protein O-mannosyl-transferase
MNQSFLKIADKWWFWMLLCIVLYANTFNHSYVIDDQIVVTRNSLTQKGIDGIAEIFSHSYLYGYDGREDESYRPLTLTTFALERSFFDSSPKVSHVIQVLLYGLTVLMLFKMLVAIFGENKKTWIIAVVFLFAVHPIHTEVVANVKSRDELLCAFFLFSSLFFFAKWVKNPNWKLLTGTLVYYFLATLSKETAVPSILLFPAISWYLNSERSLMPILRSSFLLIPIIVYFSIRSAVLSDVLIQDPIDPVANSLALAGNNMELFASNLSIFSKYMQLSIFPIALSWDYSVSQLPIVGMGTFSAVIGLILLVGILSLLVKGTWNKTVYGFGALIFVSSFIATSNFLFLINCPLGERFLFIPVLGILLIIVPFAEEQFRKRKLEKVALILLIGFVAYFTSRTIVRNVEWKSNLTIYEAGVRVSPKSVKTHFNLGTECIVQGDKVADTLLRKDWYLRALESLENANVAYSDYVNIYENEGYVYGELSKLTNDQNEKKDFLLKGKKVLEFALNKMKYDKEGLYLNQSFILTQLVSLENDTIKRNQYLDEILILVTRKKEFNAEDFHHAVYALSELKRYSELINLVELKAVSYPEKADLVAEMSRMAFARSDFEMSFRLLDVYLKMRPEDLSSLSNKGMLLEILGRKDEALKIYEEVLRRDPNQKHALELYEKLKLSR